MRPEIAGLWIDALESGNYAQGRGALNTDGEFCCLGVLCDIAADLGIVERSTREGPFNRVQYDGISTVVPHRVMTWAGLKSEVGDYVEGDNFGNYLANDNDYREKSFAEIAKIISENVDRL